MIARYFKRRAAYKSYRQQGYSKSLSKTFARRYVNAYYRSRAKS
jgi:hypothetical protein